MKVKGDFNGVWNDEGGTILCLSHNDFCKNEFGENIKLEEGIRLTAFDEDADENNKRDDLIASGIVERSPDWLKEHGSKWILRVDENGICHESDIFPNRIFLQNLYEAFNRRDIEAVLSTMAEDVKWANGWEGGFVYGRDEVREYWRRQFEIFNPHLEILESDGDGDRSTVKLRQIVRDLDGNVLDDKTVEHIFTFENGLIKLFEIGNFIKPWTENENFQKIVS